MSSAFARVCATLDEPRRALDLLDELKSIAIQAARAAAATHRERDVARLDLAFKGNASDLVTSVDRAAEAALVQIIASARPDDGIIAEEGSARAGSSGVCWLLDPLDGTTNFVHGYPQHAVAVGVTIAGVRRLGVVADTARDHLYVGVPGFGIPAAGAFCEERVLATSTERELRHALVATGFLPDESVRPLQVDILKTVLPRVRDIRRSGSAALDLCAVASGSLDAYYEFGLKPWDIAAGAAIAEAAGARVVLLDSGPLPGPLLIAGNTALVEALEKLLTLALRGLDAG
jgi:myo-inositol-1(or 4)-monophosphatase